MSAPDAPDVPQARNLLTDLIERWRWGFFLAFGCLLPLAFNGQWRIGTDSSIYLGLARSIANGDGYVFGDWAGGQIYPGLPYLLAILHQTLGEVHWPALLIMNLMTVACAVVTYRLIRLHYPVWIATCVTCGVLVNSRVVKLSNEILTDIPFLLGILLSLYGWELLRRAAGRNATIVSLIVLVAGIALAGSMRPTFWVLALAWGVATVSGFLFARTSRDRRFHAIVLTTLLAVWAVLIGLDPRIRGFRPLSGGYEREAIEMLGRFSETVSRTLPNMLSEQLPESVFGLNMHLGVTNDMLNLAPAWYLSALLVLGVLLIARKHPMWSLLALLTLLVTIVMSTVPRYYIMILPIMLLGYLRVMIIFMKWLPNWLSVPYTLFCLALVIVCNLATNVGLITEQRRTPFVDGYNGGYYLKYIRLAQLIEQTVPPGGKLMAPEGSVVSYLSGRDVISQRTALNYARYSEVRYPERLRKLGVQYAVFPSHVYRQREPMFARLIERGILRRIERLGETDGMVLEKVRVIVPKGDWRRLPKGAQPRDGEPVLDQQRAELMRERQERQERIDRQQRQQRQQELQRRQELQERREREQRKQQRAAAAHAASAPATRPATLPQVDPDR
jgi:signal transduction histidine kinase